MSEYESDRSKPSAASPSRTDQARSAATGSGPDRRAEVAERHHLLDAEHEGRHDVVEVGVEVVGSDHHDRVGRQARDGVGDAGDVGDEPRARVGRRAGGVIVANGECDIPTNPTISLSRVLAEQQELAVDAQVLVDLLPLRPVPGVRDDVQARVGQPAEQHVRLVEAAGRVVLGPQQQGRGGDLADPARLPREVLAHHAGPAARACCGSPARTRAWCRRRGAGSPARRSPSPCGGTGTPPGLRTVASLGSSTAASVLSRIRAITSGLLAMLPGVLSTSRRTRSGWWAAVQATTQPPSDSPDRCAASIPSASSRPSRWSDEHVDRVRAVGQVREAVPDHVVGGHPEVPRQPGDVAGVGLEVPAGAVQQDEVRARPGLQHARAHPADVDVAQLVVDVAQLAPDADVRGARHAISSLNRARASSIVARPALCRRPTPSRPSRREFSMVRNSTGSSAESL